MLKSLLKILFVFLVVGLAGVFIEPGFQSLWHQLSYSLREGESIIPQLVTLLISIGILASPLFIKSRTIVIAYLGFILVFLLTGLTFIEINGQFTDWEAKLIISEFGFAAGAISTFIGAIASAAPLAIGFTLVLYLIRYPLLKGGWSIIGFLPWLLPVLYVAVANGGDNIRHTQLALKVPSQILFEITHPYPVVEKRDASSISTVKTPEHHIIYVIDESIRGDLLTINNPQLNTTPKIASLLENKAYYNYGVISSTTNCSATSNLLLRTGGQPNQLPDTSGKLFSKSSLFTYAQHAGITTHYLDGQVSHASRPQNFFSTSEIESIDEYLPLKTVADIHGYEIDFELTRRLVKIIQGQNGTSFTYINKFGTHFPYETTYPNAPSGLSKKEHYQKALQWTVDDYLVDLIQKLEATKQKAIIVYTSDHGQGLGEEGSLSTHCLPENPTTYQASVPLLMIGINTELPKHLKPTLGGQYSQFQVASSLLQLMGYNIGDATAELGPDLATPWKGERYFYSGDLTGRGALRKNSFNFTEVN